MGDCLMELHSVCIIVDKVDDTSSEIYGEIKASDFPECIFDFFKAEKESAKPITADGTIPLVGPPRCIIGPDYFIGLSLKERRLGLEISKGYHCLSWAPDPGWYGRPVGVVVQGEHGYSVLHLSLFEHAMQAIVSVALVIDGDVQGSRRAIHGEIVAAYSNYKYENDYDRKYNQTRLLSVPQEKPMELQQGAGEAGPFKGEEKIEIPLSRPAVPVPLGSSLAIKPNLKINLGETSTEAVSMSDEVSFKAHSRENGTMTRIIDIQCGRIEVKVTWVANVRGEVYPDKFGDKK